MKNAMQYSMELIKMVYVCPICRNPVVPISEFKDYCSKDIPSYKYLKKTRLLGEKMVTEKSIQEFRESGMLWLINNPACFWLGNSPIC